MSSISFYDTSVVLFIQGTETLLRVLKKAAEHPDAASFPPARLYDDMQPLSFQVQIISNTAKKTVVSLTGKTGSEWAVYEQSMADICARVQRELTTMDALIELTESTLALLRTLDAAELSGLEDKMVELKLVTRPSIPLSGANYVLHYALPNFFFHISVAYGILRMRGVQLGKVDYLESFILPCAPKDWNPYPEQNNTNKA